MNEQKNSFDYVVVGAGAAGAVVARRLADAGDASVCLVEAGPSDEGDERFLDIRNWIGLIGGEFDYDYEIEPQERGNSQVRQSRARVLGGCTSHNVGISFRPPDRDLDEWAAAGAIGWDAANANPYMDRVFERMHFETIGDHNAAVRAFVEAGEQAGFPRMVYNRGQLRPSVGYFEINAQGTRRQSSSVAYLHPIAELPSTLTLLTDVVVTRVLVSDGAAVGVETSRGELHAKREVIVCCGAFDTPKLLLLSGIGPSEELSEHGIDVVTDLPGVGLGLIDHPEATVLFEGKLDIPPETTQFFEAVVLACSKPDGVDPDIMMGMATLPYDFTSAVEDSGYDVQQNALSLTSCGIRAASEGTVKLRSADPADPPRIDPRYFTHPDDERAMVEGVRIVRRLAEQEALQPWLGRELAPGAEVTSDDALAEYVRTTSNTGFHPLGTCRIGPASNGNAVLDPSLRVRGIERLRVADASVFPSNVGVNPMLTTLMVGEKCAAILLGEDCTTEEATAISA